MEMVKIFFLLLSAIEGARVCNERSCRFCSRINNISAKPMHFAFCQKLLRIENCCIRFYGAINALGPSQDKNKREDDTGNMTFRYILYYIIIGAICICISLRAYQKRTQVRRGATFALIMLSINPLFLNQGFIPQKNEWMIRSIMPICLLKKIIAHLSVIDSID